MTDDKKKFKAEWDKLLAPTPTKPTATAPVRGTLGEPELQDILRQAGWPESEVPYMAKMALKESSGIAGASRIRKAGEGQRLPETSYGLWQINTLAHPQYDPQRLANDPVYNAKAALDLWKKRPSYDDWYNSKKKLAAEGIVPGKVQSAAPQANVEDLFPNVNGFASTAAPTAPAVQSVEDLFPNVDGFDKAKSPTLPPTNPTGAYTPIDPKASAIPQTPLDVGIPAYVPPAAKPTTEVANASRPNQRPVLQPKKNQAVAPVKKQPTGAVGSDPLVGEEYELAPLDATVEEPFRAQAPKDITDQTALGVVDVDPTMAPADKIRYAASAVLSRYGVSPAEVDKWVTEAGDKAFQGDPAAGKVTITAQMLAQIKGADEARYAINERQTRAREKFEEIPPENLVTPEIADQIEASTNLSGTKYGWDELPLIGVAGDVQNTTAGLIGSGGRVWGGLAGLYRTVQELWTKPFGDGTNRFINPIKPEDIKAYRGDDVYEYMKSVADEAQAPGQNLAKFGGTRAEIFQMAGGLPGDLSRIMILSKIPGGIMTGMSADMATQAMGRGESIDKAGLEAAKGALLGSIARYAPSVGREVAEMTGSRLAGGASVLASTAAPTYATSRAFGSDVKTALKETLYNTIFAMADAAPVLFGKKIRVKDTEGNQVAVEIKPDGTAVEIDLPKDQPADVEVLDSKAAEGVKQFENQKLEASKRLFTDRQRPIMERMAEAEFTVEDKGESIAANPAAMSVLNDLLIENQKSLPEDFNGFHGLAMTDGTAIGAFTKWAENLLDKAQAEKNGSDMVTISNFIAKLKEAGTRTQGRAALFTKYDDLPEYTQGTRSEELTHLKNDTAGIQEVADTLAEVPGVKTLLGSLDEAYDKSSGPIRVDEAIAQSFRTDAETHLGRSKQEIRRAQQELFRALEEVEDFDVNAYAESLEGVSRRGDVFARYARQKQRAELSRGSGGEDVAGRETTIDPDVRGVQDPQGQGTGDSPGLAGRDTGGEPQRGDVPEAVRSEDRIEPDDFVVLRDGPGATAQPYIVKRIEGDFAVLTDAFTIGEGVEVRHRLSDLDIYEKMRKTEEPPLWTEEVDLTPAIDNMDNSSLFKSDFTDQVAGTKAPEVPKAGEQQVETTKLPITEERAGYLNSILQGKDPKITTQTIGGQEVKFLSNSKAKIMLQLDDVPYVEQKLGGDIQDPLFARLKHGSRHRFAPEIKVRNKETGEEMYIAGKAPEFPYGTRVSRRGDNLIVRHKPDKKGVQYQGKFLTDPTLEVSQIEFDSVKMIADQMMGKRKLSFDEAKKMAFNTLQAWEQNGALQKQYYTSKLGPHILNFFRELKKEDITLPKTEFGRQLIKADEWLPPVPDGYELVEKYPLGRIRDDKIGKGEGAQVYGYGHYNAEKTGVAAHYREAGAKPEAIQEYQGKPWDSRKSLDNHQNMAISSVFDMLLDDTTNIDDAAAAIKSVAEWYELEAERYDTLNTYNPSEFFKKEIENNKALAAVARQLDPEDFTNWGWQEHPGYLYHTKTNVPDNKLLRLDEKIKDQPEDVRDVVAEYQRQNFGGDERVETGEVTGKDFYRILSYEMGRLPGVKKGDVEASAYLNELGVKGMKFLDADSRHGRFDQIKWKGQDLRSAYHSQGPGLAPLVRSTEPSYQVLPKIERRLEEGHSPQTAIDLVRSYLFDEIDRISTDQYKKDWGERYSVEKVTELKKQIETLGTVFKPEDFTVVEAPKTYNHILFSGDDIDVTRIQFAKAFKDNRIFDAKTKQEVLDLGAEEFPHLFALLGRKSTGKPLVTNPNAAAGERMQAARGMETEGRVAGLANSLVQLYQSFKRQFKEIDPNESIQMARAADSFRLMSNLNNWAKLKATNDVARITEGLTREQYDVFENVLVLRDKQQAVEKGMKPGHGYADLKDVEASLKEYEKAAMADPAIAKALGERETLRRNTVQGLVDIGMLGEEALNNDRYFHRQVPQEAESNLFLSLGSKDLRVRKKGFEKKRTGEGDDYNTNYVESEIEWVSQAHAQIRKQELLREIERAVDISNDLKVEAKITGVDWRSLVPKDHRIWQPKEGSYFYQAMTVPDQMLAGHMSSGYLPSMPMSDLQPALAKGQRRPEWVLPKGVAKLMDDFHTRIDDLPHANLYSNAQAQWKQWMLINPKNYLSYNLRNFISDLDAAMAYPGMIGELPQAIKDIYGYSRSKNHPAAAEIEQAVADGVMDSGQTFAEIPDIGKLGFFKVFADSDPNALTRSMTWVWDRMKNSTNARENWIRLAAYRHLKKKIEAGETVYGASTPGQVEALTPGRQAAKVARELVGDYGGISEAGRAIRKHMIPFYSWLEINAPRYVRLIKNIPAEAKANSKSAGPRLAGRVAFNGVKLGAQLAAMTAGINVWNHVMFPDLEEDLKKTDIGKRPHLIVGRNPDGSARVFQADTALRDAMDWLNLGDAVSDVYQLRTGQATVTDKLAEAVKAPVDRVVTGLGPFKTAGELITGRSTFPTIFEKGDSFNLQTRPIRDRVEHLAQAFAVKGIYQKVMGRPAPPASGPVGQLSDWFLTMRVDPKESIFWHMKSKVQEYKKKIGKASPGSDPTEKSNTLFYYKQALRWNNPMAAERYLKQYKEEFGGTNAGLRASLKKSHPLGSLARKDWDDFEKTLTPEEKEMLQIAVEYFEGNVNK